MELAKKMIIILMKDLDNVGGLKVTESVKPLTSRHQMRFKSHCPEPKKKMIKHLNLVIPLGVENQ